MELISIIVPVYNVCQYVEECLDSIVRQTYRNLEIIIVDDGSTDGSGQVCDNIALRDERIRVIHQNNAGLSAARNTGLDKMHGQYVVFIDSDDWIHFEMIERLYRVKNEEGAEISFCSHRRFKTSEDPVYLKTPQKTKRHILTGRECVKHFNKKNCVDMVVVWNKLFRAEDFSTLRFPVGKLHEDEFINYKILYPMKKCVYIEYPMYYYRLRNDSITQGGNFQKKYWDKLEALSERKEYFRSIPDDELYAFSLRKYTTTLVELILFMETKPSEENQYSKMLRRNFFTSYINEIVSNKYISFFEKCKFGLFLISSELYKFLKVIDENEGQKRGN